MAVLDPNAIDLDTIRRFVAADSGLAMVSLARGDGSVHTSLVNAGITPHPVDGHPVVGLVVRGDSYKLRLAAQNPHMTVAWRHGWQWVSTEGPVDICGPDHIFDGVDPAAVPTLLRTVFSDIGGTHDDWDEYDRVMTAERRTAMFVEPARVRGVVRD